MDHGTLNHIRQLTDVPRPGVFEQRGHGRRGEPVHVTTIGRGKALHEFLDQQREVFLAQAKRRDLDREDVQAEEQVLPEAPGPHFVP